MESWWNWEVFSIPLIHKCIINNFSFKCWIFCFALIINFQLFTHKERSSKIIQFKASKLIQSKTIIRKSNIYLDLQILLHLVLWYFFKKTSTGPNVEGKNTFIAPIFNGDCLLRKSTSKIVTFYLRLKTTIDINGKCRTGQFILFIFPLKNLKKVKDL